MTKGETHIEAEALAMVERYRVGLGEARAAYEAAAVAAYRDANGDPFDPVVVGVGTSGPTERVYAIGVDHGAKPSRSSVVVMTNGSTIHVASRTGKSFPSATLAHFEAVDPPPKPAPRGVVFGLALAGWAS